MSGNLDAPEGGFDAIMQVVSCKVCMRFSLLAIAYLFVKGKTEAGTRDGRVRGVSCPS